MYIQTAKIYRHMFIYRFFFCALFNFRRLVIISYKASKPSWRPSPVIAHAGCMYQPLNEFCCVFGPLELLLQFVEITCDDKSGIVLLGFVIAAVGIVLFAGIVLQPELNAFIEFCCKLLEVETSTEDDEDTSCWGNNGDNSCKPRSFSNSLGSLAPGKSCLFANIRMGTP